MSDLFSASGLAEDAPRPLADRLRPKTLSEVVGQDHLIAEDGALLSRCQVLVLSRLDEPALEKLLTRVHF